MTKNGDPDVELQLCLGRSTGTKEEGSYATDTRFSYQDGKFFSCNFCMKKFFNSQAFGGHQNARKMERSEARRLQTQKMMMTMAVMELKCNASFMHSLGLMSHSQQQDDTFRTGGFVEVPCCSLKEWTTLTDDKSERKPWSFQMETQSDKQPSKKSKLDLSLRL